MRIGHFTPSYTPICSRQVSQILREFDTLQNRLGYEYIWWAEEQSSIVAIRNRNLQAAISRECDYLLMQDADIYSPRHLRREDGTVAEFPLGAIAPMLQTARDTGATMVSAIVGLRRQPHRANVEPVRAGEVYKAEKCGTGLVLIDCKQVAAWDYAGPWFMTTFDESGAKIEIGEDIYFSKLIHKMGGSIYVDGRVPTVHVRADYETLAYPGSATAGESQSPVNPAESGSA